MLTLRGLVIIVLVAGGAMTGCSEERKAPDTQAEQSSLAAEIHAVIARKGYDARSINVDRKPAMITISLFNSALLQAGSQERHAEATDIVSAIHARMVQNTEFGLVQTIHVDYMRSESDKAAGKLVDAIEFYRAPDGTFRYHKS